MKSKGETLEVEVSLRPVQARCRAGRKSPSAPQTALPRIPRTARLMALAIKFQGLVDRGEVPDYADLARLGYVTRARMTQIMNLLLLAPDIQEEILISKAPAVAERRLRRLAKIPTWEVQRQLWRELRNKLPTGRTV